MLEEIIKPSYIKLGVHASDWQDAIKQSAKPLIKAQTVTKEYVEEIIHSVQNYGPYFVVAPRVALAHAPSKYGVQKLSMGLTVLKPAVEFHNKDNDPVSFVFTLGAPDSNSHLKALQELVELLSQDDFYEFLDCATDPQDVFNYIQKYCQQKNN